MPTTCQLQGQPNQEWEQAHIQFDDGRIDGFVTSKSGPVAMGYWTGQDLPWAYSLATTFPWPTAGSPRCSGRPMPSLADPIRGS
jgi:phospholipase C